MDKMIWALMTIWFLFVSAVVHLASLIHLWTEDYYPRATLGVVYLVAALVTHGKFQSTEDP